MKIATTLNNYFTDIHIVCISFFHNGDKTSQAYNHFYILKLFDVLPNFPVHHK